MIVRTRKLSDKNLQTLAKQIFALLPDAEIRGRYAGAQSFHLDETDSLDEMPHNANERLIEAFTIRRSSGHSDYIEFARGISGPSNQSEAIQHVFLQRREPSAYFDEIALFQMHNFQNIANYTNFSADESVAISRIIGKLQAPVDVKDPAQAESFGQVLDQNLADLQRVTIEFLERSAAAREADEESFRRREKELQDHFEAKLSELEAKSESLEKKRKELNDREPQHERRRLREHLTQRLQSTISDPLTATSARESLSNYAYIFSGLVFVMISVALAVWWNQGAVDGSAAFWAGSLKSFVAGIGGAAFIWAGLSGLKAAAVAGRKYEQTIQRYAFDMDRASWTVETILQMNSIEKSQVPDHWLEAVCHDLFVSSDSKREEPRSLDALAALLDVTARARVGTNGLEFELDRKGARKLASQQSDFT